MSRPEGVGEPGQQTLLARSVALNVGGQAASLALGFGASVALARVLGPADRGLLALMVAVGAFTLVLVGLGLPLAVQYFASRRDVDPSALLGNTLLYAAGIAAVLVPLAWLAHESIADLASRGRGGEIWILAAALVPITFLDWTTTNQLVGALRFVRYNALIVVSRLAYLAAIVVLLGFLGLGVAAALTATALMSLVMLAGSLPPILRCGRPRVERALFGRMVRYGTRVQFGAIFQMANARLDVLVLQAFRPLKEVGYYVIAQTIAELVTTLALAFRTAVLPLVSRLEGDAAQDGTTIASVRHYGILAGTAAVLNAGFGTLVILFAFGPAFHPAVVPMLVLLPGIWFLGLGTMISGHLGGRGRPGTSSLLAGLAAAVTVGLDLLLIPPLGVTGAALASVVAYTVYGSASLVALSRIGGIPVRALIVPGRADFAVYPAAARRLARRLRSARGGDEA